MDWKLELVAVPVSDVDRAKSFYVEQVGFNADHDHRVSDDMRFVQLTPPGSACSISMGVGIGAGTPGSAQGLQLVVTDIEAAHVQLVERIIGPDTGGTGGTLGARYLQRTVSQRFFPKLWAVRAKFFGAGPPSGTTGRA